MTLDAEVCGGVARRWWWWWCLANVANGCVGFLLPAFTPASGKALRCTEQERWTPAESEAQSCVIQVRECNGVIFVSVLLVMGVKQRTATRHSVKGKR
ncbi:hypothetical protein E2C01_064603 [Portunus trituberculatus]|uniref:Uncharacterized protein n=1 Tax=Portunus trituberculatus TaxID=210409 RepID=A0A5B7HNT6_PORTR|nr:hypothetical protein [Portunus trituberculatus]